MTIEKSKSIDIAQIRRQIDDRVKAVRAKDIKGAMSNYAADVVSFDVVNPLQCVGLEAIRERLEGWFSSFRGPIGYEMRDLSIAASNDAAFCHSLNRVTGTRTDGCKLDMWWRATVCYCKTDGKWLVTHAHSSVPFDVESGQASLDLKPYEAGLYVSSMHDNRGADGRRRYLCGRMARARGEETSGA